MPLQWFGFRCQDGFCCGRDSGCERPSCQIGCELALTSATKAACVESCKGMTGCFNEAGVGQKDVGCKKVETVWMQVGILKGFAGFPWISQE